MSEDKLTPRQRIRLEALAQTHAYVHVHFETKPTTEEVFKKAEEIESWLKQADAGLH